MTSNAPPSPHWMFFVSWNDNVANCPIVPSVRAAIRRAETMRRVLDDRQTVCAGDRQHGVHLASDTRVVDDDDRLRP